MNATAALRPVAGAAWGRVALFVIVYAFLQAGALALYGSRFEPWWIDLMTVRPAAALLGLLAPADGVVASGSALVWPGGRLNVRSGCDGLELMTLFVAAVLVAPVGWIRGAIALVAGCLGIWVLNQMRIVALYGAFRHHRDWFDTIHTVGAPLLLVALVAAFYAWVVLAPGRPDPSLPPRGGR